MATANELRELKWDELASRIIELKQSIFDMRSKHNTGVLESTADLMKAKRDIARCNTLMREEQLGRKHPVSVDKAQDAREAKPAAKAVKAKPSAEGAEAPAKKKPAAKKTTTKSKKGKE